MSLPQTLSTSPANDGGYNALIGYLFQFLGSAGQMIDVIEDASHTADGGTDTSFCFHVEQFGQDGVITGPNSVGVRRRKFIQFKFSQKPDKNPIQPADLENIIEALLNSKKAADSIEPLPAEFVLKSNQPLSPDSKDAKAAADTDQPNKTLDEKITPKNTKKGTPQKREKRSPEFREMLKQLVFDPDDFSRAQETVADHAIAFGVNQQQEIRDAIDRILALVFRKSTSKQRRITHDEFLASLCGYDKPRSLSIDTQAPRLLETLLDQRRNFLSIQDDDLIAYREVLSSLNLTSEALIVFWGDGGCGKSSVLFEFLKRVLGEKPKAKALAAALFSILPGTKGLPELIASWRLDGAVEHTMIQDTLEISFARVKDANVQSALPILFLGIDGIDELAPDAPWRHKIAEIIRFFWDIHRKSVGIPPARLIVTCRRKEDIEQFIGAPGFGLGEMTPPCSFEITDFTQGELFGLCRGLLPAEAEVAKSLMDSLSVESGSTGIPNQPETDAPKVLSARSFSDSIIQALHHPMVWRCFMKMTPAQRLAFLNGDQDIPALMWDRYLKWFCDKASLRKPAVLDKADVRLVLRSVAKHCVDAKSHYERQQDWISLLLTLIPGGARAAAARAFDEALSAGIIIQAPGQLVNHYEPQWWKWRHAPFWEYLCTL